MSFRLPADVKVGVIAAVALLALPVGNASAQNLLDFLFGRPPDRSSSPPPPQMQQLPSRPSMTSPSGPAGPRSYDQPISNSNIGRGTAYCVRMCDGRYFPLERHATASPATLCSSLCPASQTKIYNGGEIAGSVAADGTRYASLQTAYLYRKSIVPNCTCNGRDIFGLAHIDVKADPTLRAGDTVSTGDGVFVVTRPMEARAAPASLDTTTTPPPVPVAPSRPRDTLSPSLLETR